MYKLGYIPVLWTRQLSRGVCIWYSSNALIELCTMPLCMGCPSVRLSVGIDFKIRTVEIDNKKIKLQIWYGCNGCRYLSLILITPPPPPYTHTHSNVPTLSLKSELTNLVPLCRSSVLPHTMSVHLVKLKENNTPQVMHCAGQDQWSPAYPFYTTDSVVCSHLPPPLSSPPLPPLRPAVPVS